MADPRVRHPALDAFAEVATQFCRHVERLEVLDDTAFLRALHPLLARLYAAALDLPSSAIVFDADSSNSDEVDPESERCR